MEENLENNGFNVPANYFNTLSEAIEAKVRTEKIRLLAPAEGYAVPEGYFEKLQLSILDKTVNDRKQPGKIVHLWRSNLLKYASAACFVLLSATGFYFYQAQHESKKTASMDLATEQVLYDIDEQVIIDHIQENDLQRNIPTASELALENYILNNYSQSDIASGL